MNSLSVYKKDEMRDPFGGVEIYQNIVENATDAIFTVDTDRRIRTWNAGSSLIFGYEKEEAVGRPLEFLVPKELLDVRELDMIDKMIEREGALRNYETERIAKGNKRIAVNQSQTPLYDGQRRRIGDALVIKDISGRKELEKNLRKKIEQFASLNEIESLLHRDLGLRRILEAILVGVTSEHGLRFNRAFLLLVQRDKPELKGELAIGPADSREAQKIWEELKRRRASLKDTLASLGLEKEGPDRTVNEIVSRLRVPLDDEEHVFVKALKSGKPVHVRTRDECGDEELVRALGTANFVVAPLIVRNNPIGVLVADNAITSNPISQEDVALLQIFANHAAVAINDSWMMENLKNTIEALKQTNEELKRNQERLLAAEKLSTIGEMAAKVAHEIRNPLATIGGFARALKKDVPPDCPVNDCSRSEYLQIIADEVKRLEDILNRLLDYARPIEPEYKETDIHSIMENVVKLLEPEIKKHNIQVVQACVAKEIKIVTDPRLFTEILLNLAKNAVQAMEGREGGELRMGCRVEGNDLVISVRDTGKGIQEEDKGKIFKPFYTTKARGTGLGLAIISQYLQRLGGRIDCQSEVGVGTEFTVRLPLKLGGKDNENNTVR